MAIITQAQVELCTQDAVTSTCHLACCWDVDAILGSSPPIVALSHVEVLARDRCTSERECNIARDCKVKLSRHLKENSLRHHILQLKACLEGCCWARTSPSPSFHINVIAIDRQTIERLTIGNGVAGHIV